MGSKSNRRKERHQRNRQKKKQRNEARQRQAQQRMQMTQTSIARHRQRILQQVPAAWPGELAEDVAVFDDDVLQSLSPEVAAQVTSVREALQDALDGRGDEAAKRVSNIPRSSRLSEWRLLVRGLVNWLANDFDAASEAWKRLDPERRPGRIAITMMLARRGDLEQAKVPPAPDSPDAASEPDWTNRWDEQLLHHAKLLRKIRFDRSAIRVAQTGLNIPEDFSELLVGMRKLRWLEQFVADYGPTEPELTAAVVQVALRRAYAQSYADIFDYATKVLAGPPHDRRNLLLTFFYYRRFMNADAESRSEVALREYLENDLPNNDAISAPLRGAIASRLHLNEARSLIAGNSPMEMIRWLFDPSVDDKQIRSHLTAAVKAYPAHRAVYEAHVEWLQSKVTDERRSVKSQRASVEKEMAQVMRSWSKALPEDAEPRLWLVDYLLENELTEEAQPHVEWLAASRQEDPRVRAAPWKWQLLDAMRLSRRKASIAQVPDRLERADQIWPAWLSKQWLPYWKAAWLLRSGQAEAFEQQRQLISEQSGLARDSLPDACMMLGAAQQLRVPAADLKPLRAPLEQAFKNIAHLPLDDLVTTGSFFWDLHRTKLIYSAYRLQGKTIGKELLARLAKNKQLVLERLNDQRLHAAIFWCARYQFWVSAHDLRLPQWFFEPAVEQHPMFAAARLSAFFQLANLYGVEKHEHMGPIVREAASTMRDAFYRQWFASLVDKLEDAQVKWKARVARRDINPFKAMFGVDLDDLDVDDDDDDDDDLPDCDCPDCRAARRAFGSSR